MPIDPTDLAKSIGALGSLDPEQGLAPTLQQIADGANQLFAADAAGLMLVDAKGQLRWASASDQTAQTIEDGQERLAKVPVRWRSASACRRPSTTSTPSQTGRSSPRSCSVRASARP
ncbi:MAG: hypothetical protein ACJ742_14780 [Actinomycetes bacterium]